MARKVYQRYRPMRLDFTPFVSIALLLVIFFVWGILMQKPAVLSAWDVQGCRKGIEPARSAWVLEILLIDKDTLQFCHFPSGSACRANFVTAHRRSTTLRQALLRYKKDVLTPGKLAIVIRPQAASTVDIFTDVLNELRIAGNLPYLLYY